MNELTRRDEAHLAPETAEIISAGGESADSVNQPIQAQSALEIQQISSLVRDMMAPIMESIGKMLQHNAEAMEQISVAQQMTSDRIAALEKRVRLQTPLSKSQEKCINDAIRARARELLDGKGYADDRKAVAKLGGCIRKSVLARYGVGSLREAPAYDYETAMKQVSLWNDILAVRDVMKEAKAREEAALAAAEPAAGADGCAEAASQEH